MLVRELVKIQREKKTSDVIAQLARLQLPQQEESHQLLDDMKKHFSVPQKLDRSVSEPFPTSQVGKKLINQARYKTELCRQYEEKGQCRYGEKCQFAHGDVERRSLDRHPKYKTEMCRTYHQHGFCNYGLRCNFIHNEEERLNRHSAIGPHCGMVTPLLVSPGELHLGGGGPSSGSSGHSCIQELSRSMSTAGYVPFARSAAESPSCSTVPSPFEDQLYPLDHVSCAGRIGEFSPPPAPTSVFSGVDQRPRGRPILSRSVSAAVQSGVCGTSGRIISPEVFRFDYSSFASWLSWAVSDADTLGYRTIYHNIPPHLCVR